MIKAEVSTLNSNFAFLTDRFPALEKLGSLAEGYLYSDPNSSITKMRILSETGATLGVPAICTFQTTFNDGIAALINMDKRSNKFIYYFLTTKTKDFRAINMGAAQPNLNTEIIGDTSLLLPTLPEQQEIVRILDSLFEKEKTAQELCGVIDKIDLMKKAILARAFRGQLGTNDPNEESAMELLHTTQM